MSRSLEAFLSALGEALDQMDIGIIVLDTEMRVQAVNRCITAAFRLPPEFHLARPSYPSLLDHAAAHAAFAPPNETQPGFLAAHQAAVYAGTVPPTPVPLSDGTELRFTSAPSPAGGHILICNACATRSAPNPTAGHARIDAEFRMFSETMERHAAYLATLVDGADESARLAETAKLELEREIAERCRLEAELRKMATTDGLTGALNRSEFLASGQRALEYARHFGHDLAVLMLDVDYFKSINDQHGHAAGDRALQHLTAILRAGTRDSDLIGRMGGEEFAIVLSGTSPKRAERVADRLRSAVFESAVRHGNSTIGMTISVGLATRQQTDDHIERLVARADAALYRAKQSGRNRVVKEQFDPVE